MTRILLSVVLLLLLAIPAEADCAARAPYYHKMKPSLGTALADLFLFPGAVAVTVLTVPVADGKATGDAACLPLSLAEHFAGVPRPERR